MSQSGTGYRPVDKDYFERRGLRRYAGIGSLWALGVGAVISGHYSGWNLGLMAGGWGGFALATVIVAVMYLSLVLCIAEMGAALPHTGGAYSFATFASAAMRAQRSNSRRLNSPRASGVLVVETMPSAPIWRLASSLWPMI